MRATSHTAAGPVQTRGRRGCEGRIHRAHSLTHKQSPWTEPRGPVSVVSSYRYDQADRLIGYIGPNRASSGTTSATYGYDATGLRQYTNTGGRIANEAYDRSGSPLLIEDGLVAYINGADGRPIEQILLQSSTPRYLHYDTRGSTRALTNQSGAVLASYSYDAYGNRTSPATTVENPFGYSGEYTGPETGLQYLNARYYDPATGQFITRDPVEMATRQPYSYAGGGPVNSNDPTGLACAGPFGSLCAFGDAITHAGSTLLNEGRGILNTATVGGSEAIAGALGAPPPGFGIGFGGCIGLGITFLDGEGEAIVAAKEFDAARREAFELAG